MRFLIIDPNTRTVRSVDCPTLDAAKIDAGLDPHRVDHGVIARNLGIVVFEYGLFASPESIKYFVINGSLYAGPAVVYAYDNSGETTDAPEQLPWQPVWLDGADVETAIAVDIVQRPQVTVDGEVVWSWKHQQT